MVRWGTEMLYPQILSQIKTIPFEFYVAVDVDQFRILKF